MLVLKPRRLQDGERVRMDRPAEKTALEGAIRWIAAQWAVADSSPLPHVIRPVPDSWPDWITHRLANVGLVAWTCDDARTILSPGHAAIANVRAMMSDLAGVALRRYMSRLEEHTFAELLAAVDRMMNAAGMERVTALGELLQTIGGGSGNSILDQMTSDLIIADGVLTGHNADVLTTRLQIHHLEGCSRLREAILQQDEEYADYSLRQILGA